MKTYENISVYHCQKALVMKLSISDTNFFYFMKIKKVKEEICISKINKISVILAFDRNKGHGFNANFNNISVISWRSVLLCRKLEYLERTINLSQNH